LWSRVTEGYGALPAFGLINRSKSETQGQLSRRGGAIRARLGLLFLGSRDSQNCYQPQVWNWLKEPNSSRNLRAQGLGGATQKPDGKRPAIRNQQRFAREPGSQRFSRSQ